LGKDHRKSALPLAFRLGAVIRKPVQKGVREKKALNGLGNT